MSEVSRMRCAAIVAGCAVAWFLARAVQALPLLEFGDESEHVVVALMIAAGDRLYADIFANHGPLPYALGHFWLLLTGSKDLSSYRLISLVLYVLCAAAIFASPVLTRLRARLYALALFLVPLGVVYAATTMHMLMYQSMAGALLTVELALFSVPAVAGVTPPRWAAVAAGFAAACAVFAAMSFAVAAALLAAAGIAMAPDADGARRRAIGGFLAGALAGVFAVGAWGTLNADWTGYFVYHYWFNLTVFADATRFSMLLPFRAFLRIGLEPHAMVHGFAVAIFIAAFAMLIALAVGIAFLNPRGQLGFHASTFVAGALGLGALMAAKLLAVDAGIAPLSRLGAFAVRGLVGVLAVVLVLVYQFAHSSPHRIPLKELTRHGGAPKPGGDRIYRLIRELVPANERILAVVFAPAIYIYADRLPASGNTYYVPVQAAYAKKPLWGYSIDLCKDMVEKRPKVVFLLDQLGTGKWGFADYASCAYREIVDNYVQLPWAPGYYVRREIAVARPEIMKAP